MGEVEERALGEGWGRAGGGREAPCAPSVQLALRTDANELRDRRAGWGPCRPRLRRE